MVFDTNDFNLFTNLDDTALYTTGNNGTTTGDGEYVFDWHQERLVDITLWLWNVGIQVSSFQDPLPTELLAFQRHQCGTADPDRQVVTREVVFVDSSSRTSISTSSSSSSRHQPCRICSGTQ